MCTVLSLQVFGGGLWTCTQPRLEKRSEILKDLRELVPKLLGNIAGLYLHRATSSEMVLDASPRTVPDLASKLHLCGGGGGNMYVEF